MKSLILSLVFSFFLFGCGDTSAEKDVLETPTGVTPFSMKKITIEDSEGYGDFIADAIAEELIKRGVIFREKGLEITGKAEWDRPYNYFLRVNCHGIAYDGISVSAAIESRRQVTDPATREYLVKLAAEEISDSFIEQVKKQYERAPIKLDTPRKPERP